MFVRVTENEAKHLEKVDTDVQRSYFKCRRHIINEEVIVLDRDWKEGADQESHKLQS